MENPAVSLLIDSRENTPRDRIQALTVEGVFHKIKDAAKETRAKELLIGSHPHLAEFAADADVELLCIKVKSFLLLNGLSKAHYQKL